jgi:hypothetical protein
MFTGWQTEKGIKHLAKCIIAKYRGKSLSYIAHYLEPRYLEYNSIQNGLQEQSLRLDDRFKSYNCV